MPESNVNPRLLYKLGDAADYLKCSGADTPHSPNGLKNWVNTGRIAAVKLSDGERVIPGSELLRLTQSGENP